MRAVRAVLASQAALSDVIVAISGLIEGAVTALVTPKVHNRTRRAEKRLLAFLQGLMNTTLDEKLYSVEFEEHLLPNMK